MTIGFTVRAERPFEHRLEIVGEIDGLKGPEFDLVLPSWVPGSYLISDMARYVDQMSARSADGAHPLGVQRVEKARWRVQSGSHARVEVRYSVYGHLMMTDGIDFTTDHLLFNPVFGIPYVDGRTEEPYELGFVLPSDWKIVTELPPIGSQPHRFRAPNYDELVDSPVDCGSHLEEIGFHAGGIPHRIVLCGSGGNHEPHRLVEDLSRITEAGIRLFGEIPVPRYTFFVQLNNVTDGALEHGSSNVAVAPRTSFRPESSYRKFLAVMSHEYFHLYNVKRIRPKAFQPFDYTKEVYTKLLWAMEGTTDYYAYVLMRRAGVLSPKRFLEHLASEAQRLSMVPGRRVRSLEEASYLAWIDLYKESEEKRNRSPSYYLKGLLVSQCLDLEIRSRTDNHTSLDTILRALWARYGKTGRGLAEDEMLPIASEAAGFDLAPFFAKYISGTEEIDFNAFARKAGLSFGPVPKKSEEGDDGEPGWLGVDFEDHRGLARVTFVMDGSPARRAGLSPGDEVIAVDRVKLAFSEVPTALQRAPAGTNLDLAVFRRGLLVQVPVTTGTAPAEKLEYKPLDDATASERSVYEAWVGAKWEPAEKRPA